jgi:hypothetical protein
VAGKKKGGRTMNLNDYTNLDGPRAGDSCAWYLRVSTLKQKLEHQRAHVVQFSESESSHITDHWRFEDKEKRHKSAKRHGCR